MKNLWYKLVMLYKKTRYPENVWYGGSLKRDTALGSVGLGWRPLIEKLYDAKPRPTLVTQVKEKWGGLRFYVSYCPEWYSDLIDYYEKESYEICEQCGEKGTLRSDLGWVLTLCDKHYEEAKGNKEKAS